MERLKTYLEHNETVTSEAIPYLHHLSDRYPWFSIPRILFAKINGNHDPELLLHLYDHPVPPVFLSKVPVSRETFGINKAENTLSRAEIFLPPDRSDRTIHTTTGPVKSKTDEVIENFLSRGDVKIVPDEKLQTGEDLAARSAHEDLEMVSEELAEIYRNQGLKSKAKAVYAKLSLLYPEKSVYFADIITKLEETGETPSED